ncbi:MAG: hypothetical protein U9M90_04320 [Patescibacteria group bacterium]|nr:hypothetical protein [Patescibacteria group bacterium]
MVSTVKQEKISVATKSFTRFPRVGNFVMKDPRTWEYVQKLPDMGMLNAYGLTNDGVEKCAKQIAISRKKGFNVIPNFYPEFDKGKEIAIKETLEAVGIFCFYFGTEKWILELNFSCPNSKEIIAENIQMASKCVTEVKKLYPDVVIIAKTSIVHPYHFYTILRNAGADCIHAINTIPYTMLFDSISPLENVGGGGVSGGPGFQKSFPYIIEIPKWTSLPLIFGCGVINSRDMEMCFEAGARSVSICTLAARDSKKARKLICEFGS